MKHYRHIVYILGLCASTLVACSSNQSVSLASVEHKKTIEVENYRPVGTVTVGKPDQVFSKGFSMVTLQSDKDLEKIVIAKKMAFLHFDVFSCHSETSVYSTPAFINESHDVPFSYIAFLPYNFDDEFLQNPNRVRGGTDSSTRAEFVKEGGCIKLKAGKKIGASFSSNKVKIFQFESPKEMLTWNKKKL